MNMELSKYEINLKRKRKTIGKKEKDLIVTFFYRNVYFFVNYKLLLTNLS